MNKFLLPKHVIDALTSLRDRRATGKVEIDVRDGIVRDAWVTRERIIQKNDAPVVKRDRDDA
jgi:hypothetical protein